MQFSLTEDQQAFRDTARQFATERMLPQAARWDSEKIFPVDELREAVGRLTERFADSDREAIANHQRNIEGHLARLAEEATLNRSALADELRGELRLLARTVAMSRGEAGLSAKNEG